MYPKLETMHCKLYVHFPQAKREEARNKDKVSVKKKESK